MSSHKTRIEKLESAAGVNDKKQYCCIIHPAHAGKGYNVFPTQPATPAQREAETIHFETREELEAFEARPDVDLTILEIVYASEAETRA